MLSAIHDPSARQEYIEDAVVRDVENLVESLKVNTRDTISWMIADGILNFRIAVPKNNLSGMFHAKLGIFEDSDENLIAFSGSYNSTGAANTNWEVIDIYSSLREGDKDRVIRKRNDFERIWEEQDNNLDIYRPNDKIVSKFIQITKFNIRPYAKCPSEKARQIPKIPSKFLNEESKLRKHQELAINNWFKNNGHGVFNMATGSGKTVTALSAATKLISNIVKNEMSIIVVICVPYKHLAEQWKEEAEEFLFEPIMCYGDDADWPNELNNELINISHGLNNYQIIITVNATFSGTKFQSYIQRINTNFLLIADEMHNLGAEKLKTGLPGNAQFRIGLSATPVRHMDEEGTKELTDYFGKEVIEYGLKEAIKDKTLTEYYYYPVLVEFTEEEMLAYKELSGKIAQAHSGNKEGGVNKNSYLSMLLIERARLKAGAENKLIKLKELLIKNKDKKYNLIYVGDVTTGDESQVKKVLKLVGKEVGMKVKKFTAEEDMTTRMEILKQFEAGELQTIVAIRCLDEGVDVPKTKHAYIIASSTNPRQFIQRRGRVLRLAEGKKYAYIYDFITVPPLKINSFYKQDKYKSERALFMSELERINEFAETAVNCGEALASIHDIKKELNLLDM